MRTIRLDCRQMEDREHLHDYLAQTLEFPSWYGRNLDALYDMLCDQLPVCLIFDHTEVLETYGQTALEIFRDAAKQNPGLELDFGSETS